MIFISYMVCDVIKLWTYFLGSREERGILKWKQVSSTRSDDKRKRHRVYELPFVTDFLYRHKAFHYIPFLPSFRAYSDTKNNCKDLRE